jgi:tetratricopeptide (TPR) repeat protein
MCLKKFFVFAALQLALIPAMANLFDGIKTTSKENRIPEARALYKKHLRKVDSVTAFTGFNELFAIARNLKDRSLECYIYDFHADYFSVNRGFNDLSLLYYQKAIDLATKYDLPAEIAIHTFKKGTFYYTFKKYVDAYRYFLDAYTLLKTAGFENVPEVAYYLQYIAHFYYDIDDLESAQRIMLEAIQYEVPTTGEEINMINTLALTYQKLGDDKEAFNYFTKAFDKAKTTNDSVWMGIISGNIGSIYYRAGQFDKAIHHLRFDYEQSLKYDQFNSAALAVLTLIRCYIEKEDLVQAEALLKSSASLVKQNDDLKLWIHFYSNMALLHEKKNDTRTALVYRKQYDVARDSLEIISNRAAVNRVKLKWELDKHDAQVAQLKAAADLESFRRNSLIGLLFLLMVISILVYNREKLKGIKEKELFEKQEALLQSEKARAEDELRNARQALDQYTENLKQKNELIEEFKTEIEQLQLQLAHPVDNERIEQLEKLMQAHIMTDETWAEFKRLFEKVHAGFITRLKNKFIHATETDIRLLTLLKLGLNNREMANMLCVTTEAIKKSRQRLKKKINLPEELSLEEVVSQI